MLHAFKCGCNYVCIGDAPDDDDDTRCPALEEAVERCGGLTCVRKPISNETCFQCVEGCQGEFTSIVVLILFHYEVPNTLVAFTKIIKRHPNSPLMTTFVLYIAAYYIIV